MAVTILFLIIFFAIMISVGLYCRKHATDVDGFVLAGRSIGPWMTAFAFGTSYFSAVIFVGYAGQFGWNFGLASTWIGLANCLIGSLLAWKILGRRTRIVSQKLNCRTMPDFFGRRYDSQALRLTAAGIVFVFLIPYTASLYNGLSSLFSLAFDVRYFWCILVMAVLTCVYVLFGGYMATAMNDFIQGIIMLFGIIAVVAAVLAVNGGLASAVSQLASLPTPEGVRAGAYASALGTDPLSLLFVVVLTSMGTWGLPQMVGKFYSIRSESDIKKGTVISTLFALIVAGGCYFLGGFGRLYNVDVASVGFDRIIPTMLMSLNKPVIISLVIVLVLAASMSTLSSLVLTSSSTLVLDLFAPLKKKHPFSAKGKVVVMRLFIVFFIIVSAVLAVLKEAFGFTFIAQMMGVSWGALAGAFLAPFLYGLYWKKTSRAAVWTCFFFAVGVMVIQMIVSLGHFTMPGVLGYLFASSIRSGSIAIVGGLVIVPIVSVFTHAADRILVEEDISLTPSMG